MSVFPGEFGVRDAAGNVSVSVRKSPGSVRESTPILHLLEFEHNRLFLERDGLQERLTGVQPARVVREILA